MKQTIEKHPHLITAIIFIALFLAGMRYYQLDREALGFLLLLYLLVTIGIRLDDLSRRIDVMESTFEEMVRSGVDTHRQLAETAANLNRILTLLNGMPASGQKGDRQDPEITNEKNKLQDTGKQEFLG